MSDFVFIKNGKAMTTSLQIATAFSKLHKHILESIKNLSCSQNFTETNFRLSSYTDATGRKLPMYELTKDGFMFLVMGFTGEKAAQLKENFIIAFNQMEEEIHRLQSNPIPDLSDIRVLQAVVNRMVEHENKIINIDSRVRVIEASHQTALEKVKAIPSSDKEPLELTTRAKINMLVRNYGMATDISIHDLWQKLYTEFKYRYHFDVYAREKNSVKSKLDLIEENGLIEELFATATSMFHD